MCIDADCMFKNSKCVAFVLMPRKTKKINLSLVHLFQEITHLLLLDGFQPFPKANLTEC